MILSTFLAARVISVYLVLVKPPPELADTAVSHSESMEIWRSAKTIIETSGVRLKLRRVKRHDPRFSLEGYRLERLYSSTWVSAYFRTRNRLRFNEKNSIVHWIMPRSVEGFMYGNSVFNLCADRGTSAISMSTAQMYNIAGDYRFPQSVAAMAHEMLHAVGAKDRVGAGVMDPDPLNQLNKIYTLNDPVTESTRVDIKACTKQAARRRA